MAESEESARGEIYSRIFGLPRRWVHGVSMVCQRSRRFRIVVQARDQAALSFAGEFWNSGAVVAVGFEFHGSRSRGKGPVRDSRGAYALRMGRKRAEDVGTLEAGMRRCAARGGRRT